MKKLMIAALMMLGTSAAFAGDSEPLKAILNAKDYTQAVELVKSNLNQLANSQEKAKAYDFLTKLALKKFNEQNDLVAANMQAQLTKGKIQPLDTVGYYQAAYNAMVNGVECMKYDAEPNEKGKVKPKFTDDLKASLGSARLTLVNAGNFYAQRNDADNVLKIWGLFLDTEDNPIFASQKEGEKQYLGQVAYYTAVYANQAQLYDKAEKYAEIAMQDPAMKKDAESLKYAIAEENLKTRADSLAYAKKMEDAFAADPKNDVVFTLLSGLYSGLNMTTELNGVIDKALAANPNNFYALATKGQQLVNVASKSQNPNWDEPIDYFKKAIAVQASNPAVLTYLGFALNAKAQGINGNEAKAKELYTESVGYLEKARDIDPDRRQSNWSYPLYQCYYALYGADDSRTKELESLLKK